MELLKNCKDFFKDLRSDTAFNEMFCDARELANKTDILADFELTQPRHRIRRMNINFDYEKALRASLEVSYLIGKTMKPNTIGESLILPEATKMTSNMHGDKYGNELKTIPFSREIPCLGGFLKCHEISSQKFEQRAQRLNPESGAKLLYQSQLASYYINEVWLGKLSYLVDIFEKQRLKFELAQRVAKNFLSTKGVTVEKRLRTTDSKDTSPKGVLNDEAHFWLNGYVNKQNCRIWSEANPQVYVETPLHREKVTVWCALRAGGIIGPYLFKNDEGYNVTVNGDRYRAMTTNFFIPEWNNHDVQELWFQQDGTTCHTARATIGLLKDTFGDRLISRFGPVNWPPRSCDLTPLDYFLWGYVKSLVYADKPQTLDHLEDNIHRVIADIRPQMMEKSHRKLDVQIGLHPSQPWQSYARNHI
ncbi:uncharacterized protein TNCV_4674701 [Trichonephila clavipes]|nr:uncharacterized protein TNCV_4674701 [Trichonephila clavipes]